MSRHVMDLSISAFPSYFELAKGIGMGQAINTKAKTCLLLASFCPVLRDAGRSNQRWSLLQLGKREQPHLRFDGK